MPIAVNVGDAMFCLSLEPLLGNVEVVGLGPALHILRLVAEMTRKTVEGQAIELDWVKKGVWDLSDNDYVKMVVEKTGWYSFMAPVGAAAIVAGLEPARRAELVEFARVLSVAFQIQDDVLNLRGEVEDYGKEIGGDLWEGKRTLMLLHVLRHATDEERGEALRVLALARPQPENTSAAEGLKLIEGLLSGDDLTTTGKASLRRALACLGAGPRPAKTVDDVRRLMTLVRKYGSIDYASGVAESWADNAERLFRRVSLWLPPSTHRDILQALIDYVHSRNK